MNINSEVRHVSEVLAVRLEIYRIVGPMAVSQSSTAKNPASNFDRGRILIRRVRYRAGCK